MCSSIFQLAPGSRDFSQAKYKLSCKAEQIQKITFKKLHSKLSWMNKVVILSGNSCHFVSCSACNNKLFSSQLEKSHLLNGTTSEVQHRKYGPRGIQYCPFDTP